MISFSDVFKKSFLEGFQSSDIRTVTLLAVLSFAFVISCYIFLLYRLVTRKTFYSKTFNISLVGVALITTAIITTIQSSLVVSLGMVGALSIVRFRTAIKEPMDLMFLFWSISTGIMCGAGLAKFALALALFMTVAIFVLDKLPMTKCPLILIINASNLDVEDDIETVIKKYVKYYSVKSRNLSSTSVDITYELRCKNGKDLLKEINELNDVSSVSLLSHDGEITF